MTDIKLVISDLDGTLLDDHKRLTPEAILAVQALRERGIAFTFATGRVDRMTWEYAHTLGLTLPTITCNGALVKMPFGGEVFTVDGLEDAMVVEMVEFALKHRYDLLVYTEDEVYKLPWSQRIKVFERYNHSAMAAGLEPVPIVEQSSVPPVGEAWRNRAIKMFIEFEEKDRQAIEAKLQTFDSIEVVQSDHGSLDVNAKGCSKGRAVKRLAERLNLPLSEVCTLGDQHNDQDMIEIAGCGIAMGNAQSSVKAVADFVAPTNMENGFAYAIHHLVLNATKDDKAVSL